MEKKFAIVYDGFVQDHRMYTLDEAKRAWANDVKNTLLYEYNCSVYELDENKKFLRIVPVSELKLTA